MARERKLTPEEIALIKAQTARLGTESAQAQQDAVLKAQLAREQLTSDQTINASKIGLGREELSAKDKQSQLAAAMDVLGIGSKESIAKEGEKGALRSDLVKRLDIDPKTLATALAESGDPSLYNARAREDVGKRETAINSLVPALKSANSDAERQKKIKPALDALGTGAYDEALARAYPKPENAAARATPTPALWDHAPATNESNWTSLANTLLGKSAPTETAPNRSVPRGAFTGDLAPGSNNQYPVLPNTPEINFAGTGRGSLEGSRLTNLEGGRSELATPSGGTIGFNTPQTERRAGLLGSLINPNNPSTVSVPPIPAPAGVNGLVAPANVTPVAPTPTQVVTAPVQPTTLSQLLTNPGNVPTPTPTPLISPTGTPVPAARPELTPAAIAELLKKYKTAGTSY